MRTSLGLPARCGAAGREARKVQESLRPSLLRPGPMITSETDPTFRSRVSASLLGGAIGDQLGAGVEFLRMDEIRSRFGEAGVTGPTTAYGRGAGRVTDDTQMTLFVAEGLIRAEARSRIVTGSAPPGRSVGAGRPAPIVALVHAHLRWLHTQGVPAGAIERMRVDADRAVGTGRDPEPVVSGWLVTNDWLHHGRAPGNTCLAGLRGLPRAPLVPAPNASKGCGGVMRAAPVGLARPPHTGPGGLAHDVAGLTHGHPTGRIAAAGLAQIVSELCAGRDLPEAIASTSNVLRRHPGHEETLDAVDVAVVLARRGRAADRLGPEAIEELLGGGWVAEEALAISLCCALVVEAAAEQGTDPAEAFRIGALLAVNHSGDSDSTGAIFGNLVGARLGEPCLPPDWLADLEGRETVETMGADFAAAFAPAWEDREPAPAEAIDPERYPPW